jgi:hypothetical protein
MRRSQPHPKSLTPLQSSNLRPPNPLHPALARPSCIILVSVADDISRGPLCPNCGWTDVFFRRSDEQQISLAPLANLALRASMTFGTQLRSIESSRGIEPVGMSSVCYHDSRRISATSISNPPNAISTRQPISSKRPASASQDMLNRRTPHEE